MRPCYWCGEPYEPTDNAQLFCKPSHSEAMDKWRSQQIAKEIVPCPHPEKVAFTYRGLAYEAAARLYLRVYLCKCGVYHLTKQVPRIK